MIPKEDIPSLAWIEQQVIGHAVRNDSISRSVRKVEDEYRLPKGSFGKGVFQETRTISLLYFLLVMPREIWLKDDNTDFAPLYSIWSRLGAPATKKHKCLKFIRRLRNSIAHARFEFESGGIRFLDENPRDDSDKFNEFVSYDHLFEILQTVGQYLTNMRNIDKNIALK